MTFALSGAGSAGLVAASAANRSGARTTLIETDRFCGECLPSGCIPGKTFLHSANLYYTMKKAGQYGLPVCQAGTKNIAQMFLLKRSERIKICKILAKILFKD
jgi:pyruvate/2-oxoglutarate dehydrogenase complex dihydrolipoamide dehydrogenase (E3) component